MRLHNVRRFLLVHSAALLAISFAMTTVIRPCGGPETPKGVPSGSWQWQWREVASGPYASVPVGVSCYAWYQPLTASPNLPPRLSSPLSPAFESAFSPSNPAAMEPFEDDNPFESEPERLQSDSSSSRVNVSGVSSPDLAAQPAHPSSPPMSPSRRNTFPSPGSHRQPQAFKSDFCCGRDQWLHSGEDAEILVSLHLDTYC